MKSKIIFEDNHVLVVEKPQNMPVQGDESGDLDMLNELKTYIKEKYNKPGNVFLGLVHRLDRPVGGVMVFAKTSKAASRISEQIRNHEVRKTYLTIVEGTPEPKKGELVHFLLKDERKNTVTIAPKGQGKEARLLYETIDTKDNTSCVKVELITGRSHQIRVQFAATGHPIIGDSKYGNANMKGKFTIALWAYQLGFMHPTKKEPMTFSCKPPQTEPWSAFNLGVLQ